MKGEIKLETYCEETAKEWVEVFKRCGDVNFMGVDYIATSLTRHADGMHELALTPTFELRTK